MIKLRAWLQSEEPIFKKTEKKEKKPFDPTGLIIGAGALAIGAAVFGFGVYEHKKGVEEGITMGAKGVRDGLLNGEVWDVTCRNKNDPTDKGVATIGAIISRSEDEFADVTKMLMETHRCSEENINQRVNESREKWKTRHFDDYINS